MTHPALGIIAAIVILAALGGVLAVMLLAGSDTEDDE